ncbi:MAG: glycosyltransferase family 2 protein [Elusimicrobiota bacterium]
MSSVPRVSVVIPAYNVAPFIGEALESVFSQTFADYEVIVVNDGSPDTQELESALAPRLSRLRYIKQANQGASAARNAGLKAARGEFVAFLDADDAWLPEYLKRQLKFLDERGADLVCADAAIFGETRDAGRTFMQLYMGTAPAAGGVTFLDLLSAEKCLITSGILVRLKTVLEVGLFDEGLRNAQDYDLWMRLARHNARLAYQRETLLRYRVRRGSLTGDAINSNLRDLRVFDKIEREYSLGPDESREASAVIRKRRAQLEYDLGALYLLKRDFSKSADSFSRAERHGGGWKPRAALRFVRAAPQLMLALYTRRLEHKRR